MDGKSLDIQKNNIESLRELFPNIFSEGKIDMEKFKAAFCDDIDFQNERYTLNWAGKTDAFHILQERTTATLKPQPELSVNFETTENVFIEGENLEVLKVLQKSYFNKIKCIIIDLPYNTGNDSFIYHDRFKEKLENYERRIGEKDEEGYLMKEGLFRKNSRENGHYHSNWLNMMLPRLFLARNLLRDDGVIFVHIDDNEVHNLRMLMNEIFGEENFFTQIIVRSNSRGQTYKQIAKTHEYILIYTKNFDSELNELEKDDFNNDLNLKDTIGNYNIRELRNRNPKFGKHNRPNLFFPIFVNPHNPDKDNFYPVSFDKDDIFSKVVLPFNSEGKESCWRWSKSKGLININKNTLLSNLIAKKKNDGSFGIFEKYRKTTYKPKSIWDDNRFLTETGTVQLKELGIETVFDFPKPVELEKQLINLIVDDNDILLDFFAGSGTTAHAVFQLNKEDGGNRKFILVQLPELCDENSEAYKAGYKTIADISRERIRRVIHKMEKEQRVDEAKNGIFKDEFAGTSLDLGFKSYKLSPSNFKIWRSDEITEENIEKQMDLFINPIKPESQTENMLVELMLKSGYQLTDKVENKGNYYIVSDELIIALTKMDLEIATEIIHLKPQKVIVLDRLFAGNDKLKTNTFSQMRDAGVKFKTI